MNPIQLGRYSYARSLAWRRYYHAAGGIFASLPRNLSVREAEAQAALEARNFDRVLHVVRERGDTPRGRLLSYELDALANLVEMADLDHQVAATAMIENLTPTELLTLYRFTSNSSLRHKLSAQLDRASTATVLPLNALIMLDQASSVPTNWTNEIEKRMGRRPVPAVDYASVSLHQANRAVQAGDLSLQLKKINAALQSLGCAPVAVKDSARPVCIGNMKRSTEHPLASGPLELVTVILCAYNAEKSVEAAIRSILDQSHSAIELCVVNDCSTDGTAAAVKKLQLEDSRIRFFETPINSGPYRARNIAIQNATGTYFTFQDADDWAHPDKIKTLVSALQGSPTAAAVQPYQVRISDAGELVSRHGNFLRRDASSTMFKRKMVLEKVGYFDEVRAGADGEYEFRLQRVLGRNALKEVPKLLNFVQMSSKSLSGGGKFAINEATGAFSPLRNRYRRAFLRWHEESTSVRLTPAMKDRPFVIPDEMLAPRLNAFPLNV